MDLDLQDRVVIVTGGSRGLGGAAATALVAEGARVVLAGRTASALDDAVTALGADRATAVVADLADPDTPDRLVAHARTTYGRLDGALVSVGGPQAGTVLGTSDEAWTAGFASVFLGAVRMSRVVAAALADGEGGALALVLSSSAKNPIPGLAVSNGLRPGLAMVVKTLADEVGPAGVRVNGVLPGRLDTERVRELDAASGDADAAREASVATIPLRRYGDPAELGRVAAFLLSPAASYVTGAMVPVDGGLTRSL